MDDISVVKKRKLRWYVHIIRTSDKAKTILFLFVILFDSIRPINNLSVM